MRFSIWGLFLFLSVVLAMPIDITNEQPSDVHSSSSTTISPYSTRFSTVNHPVPVKKRVRASLKQTRRQAEWLLRDMWSSSESGKTKRDDVYLLRSLEDPIYLSADELPSYMKPTTTTSSIENTHDNALNEKPSSNLSDSDYTEYAKTEF